MLYKYIYCLLNDNKSAQKVLSKDLKYEKTFRLSSRTPCLQNCIYIFAKQGALKINKKQYSIILFEKIISNCRKNNNK